MKILGIHLDNRLTWSSHISKTMNKLGRLTSGLKFIRNRLSKSQFLKVLTSQYYGMCYYGGQVWLGSHTRKMDLKKIDSLHFRLLRIVKRDYKRTMRREELDKIGRARPTTWSKYATSSTVVKVLRDQQPSRLFKHLSKTLYYTRREENRIKFFDASMNKGGYQAIGNRLTDPLQPQ